MAAIVDEEQVRPLGELLQHIATKELNSLPEKFEFHGQELWNGTGVWKSKETFEFLVAYQSVVEIIPRHKISMWAAKTAKFVDAVSRVEEGLKM